MQNFRALQDSIDVLSDSDKGEEEEEEEGIDLEDIANLIKSLKNTILEQSTTIKNIQKDLKEIKPSNKASKTKTQNSRE